MDGAEPGRGEREGGRQGFEAARDRHALEMLEIVSVANILPVLENIRARVAIGVLRQSVPRAVPRALARRRSRQNSAMRTAL